MMIFGRAASGVDLERQTAFAGTGLSFDALLNQNATTASQLTEQRAFGFQEVGMMGLAQAPQSVSPASSESADEALIPDLAIAASPPASISAPHLDDPTAPKLSTRSTANAAPQPVSDGTAIWAQQAELTATTDTASEAVARSEIGAAPALSSEPESSMAYAEMVSTQRETIADQKAPVLMSLEIALPETVHSDIEPNDMLAGSTAPTKAREAAQDQADRGAFRVAISNSDDGLNVAVIAPGIASDSTGQLRRRVLDLVTAHKLMLAGISINGSSSMISPIANQGGQNGR